MISLINFPFIVEIAADSSMVSRCGFCLDFLLTSGSFSNTTAEEHFIQD